MAKTSLPYELARAEKRASELLHRYGVVAPDHIRVEDIAFDVGLTVVEGTLAGAVARLVRRGSKGTIRVSNRVENEGRKRFSIAHELAHFLLEHGYGPQKLCSEKDLFGEYHGTGHESIANAFAGELLLPKILVEPMCDVREVDFTAIRHIANQFSTSLTATAIKFVRLCPERCAVVFSQVGRVKWYYASEDFGALITRDQRLDQRSLAYDYFKGNSVSEDPEDVPVEAWLSGSRARSTEEVVEHSVPIGSLKAVLTTIWIRP
jgi:hypothetical protein